MRGILRGTCGLIGAVSLCLAAALAATPADANGRPGDFDYYVLTLTWSPTYCAEADQSRRGHRRPDPECSGSRPYAFVLHGLWPQYSRGWPDYCHTAKRPWVPNQLIGRMVDIMPSRDLVIHEYKKHGTCSGLTPDRYFALARRAYGSVVIPERFVRPDSALTVSPADVEAAFLNSNPQLTPDMIAVGCSGRRRLSEVRICLSKDLTPRVCGQNEDQKRLCRAGRVVMPPVRGGRQGSR